MFVGLGAALWLCATAVSGVVAQAPAEGTGSGGDDPAAVLTTVDPCVPVDVAQFRRVLSIELGTSIEYSSDAPSEVGRTWVHLSCTEQGIELRLDDAVTRKSMVRVLDASRLSAGSRTRLLALAVAEFVVASWVELRIRENPAIEPVGPRPSPTARRAAERTLAVRTPVGETPRAAPGTTAWELSGVFRLEGWSSQIGLVPTFALRMGQRPTQHFAFVLGADFGTTEVSLAEGQVQLALGSVLGAAFFVTRAADFDVYAGGGGRFAIARLQGKSDSARLRADAFVAPYAGPLVMSRFAYRASSSLRLLVELEAGIVTLPVKGLSGKTTVIELNGAWLSAGLGLGVAF